MSYKPTIYQHNGSSPSSSEKNVSPLHCLFGWIIIEFSSHWMSHLITFYSNSKQVLVYQLCSESMKYQIMLKNLYLHIRMALPHKPALISILLAVHVGSSTLPHKHPPHPLPRHSSECFNLSFRQSSTSIYYYIRLIVISGKRL